MVQINPNGMIARLLSKATFLVDGQPAQNGVRQSTYGEQYVMSLIPDMNVLADEGSVFTVNNNQTGIATAAAPTAFSATNPFLTIFNGDSTGGKSIYLHSVTLVATAAGTAGASLQAAVTLDTGNRFSSGGTALTSNIANVNGNVGTKSVAVVNAGNLTATSATGGVRTLVGNRALKGAIPVALDEYALIFGGIDATAYLNLQNTITKTGIMVPPCIIPPGSTALVHIWLPSQSGASSYAPEVIWFER